MLTTLKKRSKTISKKTSENTTVVLFEYRNILLKTYIEIINTGNYNLLIISGKPSKEALEQKWEDIVEENSKFIGSYGYYNHINDVKGYNQLLNRYILDKAILSKLALVVDHELIDEMNTRGYRISKKNSTAYAESLQRAEKRAENYVTRMRMKANEMKLGAASGKESAVSFDAAMANLSLSAGFNVPDDITLARYNEMSKAIKQRMPKKKTDRKTDIGNG